LPAAPVMRISGRISGVFTRVFSCRMSVFRFSAFGLAIQTNQPRSESTRQQCNRQSSTKHYFRFVSFPWKLATKLVAFRLLEVTLALTSVIALQILVVHWGPAQALFDTVGLTLSDWSNALAIASSVLLVNEACKLVGYVLATNR